MHVTLAVPAFLPARAYGGPIENILRMAPALTALGTRVTVVTSTASAPGVADLAVGRTTEAGIDVLRLETPYIHRWAPWVRWPPNMPLGSVMHVFGAWNGLSYAAMAAARRSHVPWVWEPAGMLVTAGRRRHAKRCLAPWHRRLAQRAAAVVWTSRREAHEAGLAWLTTGVLRPNPLLPPPPCNKTRAHLRATFGWRDSTCVWGYLGRIEPRKGIDRMLTAWRAAQPTHNAQLVCAGPVQDAAVAAAIDTTPGALRLPLLDAARRWDYLRALDALVLMPRWGENFGNVVAEAVAVGTPVLVSDAVGAGEWLAADPGVRIVDDAALLAAFAASAPPPRPRGLPPALAAATVAAQQLAIWQTAHARQP